MFKNTHSILLLLTVAVMPLHMSHATSLPSTPQAAVATAPTRAFFVNLKNNQEITSPFTVKFGIEGMKIAPAGKTKSGAGHFHLLIDSALPEAQGNVALQTDAKHLHFGQGQTEANLVLAPGKHTLQIVMGDGAHKLHNPPIMSEVITIQVK